MGHFFLCPEGIYIHRSRYIGFLFTVILSKLLTFDSIARWNIPIILSGIQLYNRVVNLN